MTEEKTPETLPEASDDRTAEEKLPTVEEHAKGSKRAPLLFGAAKALHGWPVGKRMTAEDFEKALDRAGNVRLHGSAFGAEKHLEHAKAAKATEAPKA